MKNTFLIALLLSTLFSCTTLKIEELSYGRSNSKILRKTTMDSSPNGSHNSTQVNLNIIEKTDSINAILGVQFGVEYKVVSKKAYEDIDLTWYFPIGMTDKNGKKVNSFTYTINKPTNSYTNSNFTLEEKYEVVKGLWTFTISKKGKELYRRNFYLY